MPELELTFRFRWNWSRSNIIVGSSQLQIFLVAYRFSSSMFLIFECYYQRWSRQHKARGQGQGHKKNPRPRPRTAFPRTNTLEAKDRNARGQGQGPRTQAQVLSKKKDLHKNFSGDLKKKRSSQKFFRRSPQENVFQSIFQALHKILTFQKIVLSSSRGQANFRGLEASRPRT